MKEPQAIELKKEIVKALKPNLVIALQVERELEPLLSSLKEDGFSGQVSRLLSLPGAREIHLKLVGLLSRGETVGVALVTSTQGVFTCSHPARGNSQES